MAEPTDIGAWVHHYAPHSPESLYVSSASCALLAVLAVYARCRLTRSHNRLPANWVVTIASIAAPVPTWALLIVMPLDADLSRTVASDPVVVALAGLYGLSAALRDGREMTAAALRRARAGARAPD